MAYYCGECIVWRGSSDENKYGERWCSYSRRYERSDQNTYGCKGFLYAGRAVLTKVCEILKLDIQSWFDIFDKVKDAYLVPQHMDLLFSYCGVGPVLAEMIDKDEQKNTLAKDLLDNYLTPARLLGQSGMYQQSAELFQQMVELLKDRYALASH